MKKAVAAMTKLAFFAYNYNHTFIEDVWGTGSVKQHLFEKFGKCHEKKGPTLGFWEFYMDLSQENKDKLNDYILKNYKGMRSMDDIIFNQKEPFQLGDMVLGGEITSAWKDEESGFVYEITTADGEEMTVTHADIINANNEENG